jgi:4-alpha-glucanotransferase
VSIRRSGILIPLFSAPGDRSWGIGDIGDLPSLTAWLAGAGQQVLQLLPINEMAPSEQSPYSAISAMAIDPIYIDVSSIPEFAAAGGEAALSEQDRTILDEVRRASTVRYSAIRALKQRVLRSACARFVDTEVRQHSERARAFASFLEEQSWWIDEYALFRAIHFDQHEWPWTEWPDALRRRDKQALAEAASRLATEVMFRQFLQWIAHTQWMAARKAAGEVELFGDLPFMVDGDSADVWARQDQFHLDVSLGVPPDAFSDTGQDWGMPVYRWEAIAATDFQWLRDRARRTADLYGGYRIDHLVGFYRTYARPRSGAPPFFTPDNEADQIALGERLMRIFASDGADVIAEDLGVVPDFVRSSLARLGIPGFRVFRWERYWHGEGQPFVDPSDYPPASVATSGTHDTETSVVWWESAPEPDRRQAAALETMKAVTGGGEVGPDALLEVLMASASALVLFPVQDVFGWRGRINEPGTVSERNWTFRLPWPSNRLNDEPVARARQAVLREWARKYRRL